MPFVIGSECIDNQDHACVDECPVDCIYEGERKNYINPVECIDCGACELVCPQLAIFPARKARSDETRLAFVAAEAAFFTEVLPGRDAPLGNPGGAEAVGHLAADVEPVRSWATEE